MSTMDKDTVRKVLRLVRLEAKEEQLDGLAVKLGGILTWIEQLREVDTKDIEPLANVVDINLKMRPDVVNDGGDIEKVLANAPEVTENYFVVPKVVEQEA